VGAEAAGPGLIGGLMLQLAGFAATGIVVLIILIFTRGK
jgi:hypothetical protein